MKYWFWANKFIITSHESGIDLPTALSYISRNNEWRKGAKSVTETFSSRCFCFILSFIYRFFWWFLSFFLLSRFDVRRFYDVNCQKIRPYQTDAACSRELCNYYFSTFVSVSNSKCIRKIWNGTANQNHTQQTQIK